MGRVGREIVYGWVGERRSRCSVGTGAGVRQTWAMTARSRGDMYIRQLARPARQTEGLLALATQFPRRRSGATSGRYQGPRAYEEAFAEIVKPPILPKAVTTEAPSVGSQASTAVG